MASTWVRSAGAVILALALGACGRTAQQPATAPEVGVVAVHAQNVPLTRSVTARLSAYRSADVRARVAGVLLKRVYKEGSAVKQGQLLFQIDPAPYQAALDSAVAKLAQAQANYTNAHVNAERARKLAPQGYISASDLDAAIAAERSDKAAVQAARAGVEAARINLGYTNVTSPIGGRAEEQQVTEGALVGNGTATLLTTVDQLDPLYANFTLPVDALDALQQAQHAGDVSLRQPGAATAQVSLPDGTRYAHDGNIDFSSTLVDPATNSVKLRALIPNPEHRLLPGSFVFLRLTLGERHGVFLVPQAAVQRDVSGNYVLVVGKDGKVAHRTVATDGTHGLDWIVTSGLAAGDRIIASGIQAVQVGEAVKTTPWQAPAAGGSATAPATSGDGE